MKNKIFFIIVLLAAAGIIVGGILTRTSAPVNTPPIEAPLTKLLVNQIATFSDGLKIHLLKIDDSRCKPGVQCVWQGELKATLELSGATLPAPVEITLGSVNTPKAESTSYLIVLKDITENSVSLAVSKK